jgi:putative hydrolase of the HAD superfamily
LGGTPAGVSEGRKGVLLDVGGVFIVPRGARLAEELAVLAGLPDAAFDRAHFEGMRAMDGADLPGTADWSIYLGAYLSSLGVASGELPGSIDALSPLWAGPSVGLWRQVLAESVAGLRALHAADLKLGIVSNSDGSVEAELLRSRVCQVGPGDGVPVLTVIDSGVVGVAKPDPAIFDFALPALGLDPADVLYVGDSVTYDVRAAEAAGMTPLHFDPFGLCDDGAHAHVAVLDEVLDHA